VFQISILGGLTPPNPPWCNGVGFVQDAADYSSRKTRMVTRRTSSYRWSSLICSGATRTHVTMLVSIPSWSPTLVLTHSAKYIMLGSRAKWTLTFLPKRNENNHIFSGEKCCTSHQLCAVQFNINTLGLSNLNSYRLFAALSYMHTGCF